MPAFKRLLRRWEIQANRSVIKAVDAEGLQTILEQRGLGTRFKRSELTCKFCREPVDPAHVYGVFPQGGDLKLVCDRPECVAQLLELLEAQQEKQPRQGC